ncbi:MAG: hypothetical protein ACETWQ_01820 [Phycisphaerae bacterium]
MNTQKKIEKCLKSAPKPATPDGLLNRLQEDVAAGEIKKRVTVIRRWFAPANDSISPWRVAATVAIAILLLMPLSYGATKLVEKCYITFKATFIYPEPEDITESEGGYEGRVAGYGVMGGFSGSADLSEKEAMEMAEEIRKLCAEGKAEEVEPGVWMVTLSNGKKIHFGGADPEFMALTDVEKNKLLKKQFDEINELRKAGKFERTFIKEIEINGVMHRFYEDSFTLSDGKVIKMGAGEPVKDDNKD